MTFGFYVDMTRCIGCRTCQVACKDRHNLQQVGVRPRRVESAEVGNYPDCSLFHLTMSCNHCADPACVKGCPTGAMHKTEDGTVVHNDEVCVLCRNCMTTCPYGAPQYDPAKDRIVKCDGCKDLRDAGIEPNCVAACPMRAIEWGDVEQLAAAHPDAVHELPCTSPSHYSNPNLLIKANRTGLREDYREVTL